VGRGADERTRVKLASSNDTVKWGSDSGVLKVHASCGEPCRGDSDLGEFATS
jgi:hypothetical protein